MRLLFRSLLMDVQAPARRKKHARPPHAANAIGAVTATRPTGSRAPTLNMRKLLRALQAVRDGDFSVRLPSDQTGIAGKLADTFNEIVSANQRMARELERVGQIVGKDGKTRQRVSIDRRSGAWGAMEARSTR